MCAAFEFTVDFNRSGVPLHDALHNCQTKSDIVARTRSRPVNPIEPVQNMRKMLRRNATARVHHTHLQPRLVTAGGNLNRTILWRMRDRVRDEIADRLLEERPVEGCPKVTRYRRTQVDACFRRSGLVELLNRGQLLTNINVLTLKRFGCVLGPCEKQQALNHTRYPRALLQARAKELAVVFARSCLSQGDFDFPAQVVDRRA